MRSYCFIEDCLEGIIRLMKSDLKEPINLGSSEAVSVKDLASVALSFDGKTDVKFKHLDGPMGVRGRNSDNKMIQEKLGWAPSIALVDGLRITYNWIKDQIAADKSQKDFKTSEIVSQAESVKTLDTFTG